MPLREGRPTGLLAARLAAHSVGRPAGQQHCSPPANRPPAREARNSSRLIIYSAWCNNILSFARSTRQRASGRAFMQMARFVLFCSVPIGSDPFCLSRRQVLWPLSRAFRTIPLTQLPLHLNRAPLRARLIARPKQLDCGHPVSGHRRASSFSVFRRAT